MGKTNIFEHAKSCSDIKKEVRIRRARYSKGAVNWALIILILGILIIFAQFMERLNTQKETKKVKSQIGTLEKERDELRKNIQGKKEELIKVNSQLEKIKDEFRYKIWEEAAKETRNQSVIEEMQWVRRNRLTLFGWARKYDIAVNQTLKDYESIGIKGFGVLRKTTKDRALWEAFKVGRSKIEVANELKFVLRFRATKHGWEKALGMLKNSKFWATFIRYMRKCPMVIR